MISTLMHAEVLTARRRNPHLKRYASPLKAKVNETDLRVDLPGGARIGLFGADNPDTLRGLYFDGVVLDEYGDMSPRLFGEVLRPALSDRRGFAVMIGTPKGRNHFWRTFRDAEQDGDWYAARFRASETGVLPEEELSAARRQMTEAQYAQEFECSFEAAVLGAYYGAELAAAESAGRIGRVPWEPKLRVHTAWDLGIGDSTAIWFWQQTGREIRIIDYYESHGVGLSHYARVLSDKPYAYGRHLLPHDVGVKELGTGRSRLEVLRSLGIRPQVLRREERIENGIEAVRQILPRCWFDAERCGEGVEHLRLYRRDWDERAETFRIGPRHDSHSHAADAFRYLARGLKDQRTESPPPNFTIDDWELGAPLGAPSHRLPNEQDTDSAW